MSSRRSDSADQSSSINISYLGPRGTFSQQAAESFGQIVESQKVLTIPRPHLRAVALDCVESQSLGAFPYYNRFGGLIPETLDLMSEHDLEPVAAMSLPLEFASASGASSLGEVSEVYSHSVALAQCSDYLAEHWAEARTIAVASTAEAADIVARTRQGLAVAREEVLISEGLTVLHRDIGNRRQDRRNHTQFLLASRRAHGQKGVLNLESSERKRTLIAVVPTPPETDSLSATMRPISAYGIQVVRIHSRPTQIRSTPHTFGTQQIYLELACAPNSKELRDCVGYLRKNPSVKVQILGAF